MQATDQDATQHPAPLTVTDPAAERLRRDGRAQIIAVVTAYAVFSALWILVSDKLVEALIGTPGAMLLASVAKGWLFVIVTALLLYAMMRRVQNRLADMQSALRAAELEELRTLRILDAIVASSDDAIYAKDTDGRYLIFNPASARIVARDADAVLGRDDTALFGPEIGARMRALDERAIAEGRPITLEERLDTPHGPRVFLTTKGPLHGPDGTVLGVFGISRDYTARSQDQHALAAADRFKSDVLNSVDAHIAVLDHAGNIVSVNDAWTGFGVDNSHPDAAPAPGAGLGIGANYLDVCRRASGAHTEQALDALHGIEAVLAGSVPRFTLEYPCHAPDGTQRWFLMSVTPLERGVGGAVIAHTSITRRKQIEQDLRDLSARQQTLLATIPDLVWLKDPQGVYLAANPRMQAYLGASEAGIVGRTDVDFVDATQAEAFRSADQAAMRADKPLVIEEHLTFASDGHREIVQTVKTPLYDAEHRLIGVLGIARDISSIREAEAELRRQADEIGKHNAELERFNRMMVGRELDMIELKRQVNELAQLAGRAPPYPIGFTEREPDRPRDPPRP